ncbi:hypothetical protein DFH06DRAFT_1259964 [Mycena polygramma]|nr:hypothetical protein DFH06DRAFT_1259964 [Mycena polygramma]
MLSIWVALLGSLSMPLAMVRGYPMIQIWASCLLSRRNARNMLGTYIYWLPFCASIYLLFIWRTMHILCPRLHAVPKMGCPSGIRCKVPLRKQGYRERYNE